MSEKSSIFAPNFKLKALIIITMNMKYTKFLFLVFLLGLFLPIVVAQRQDVSKPQNSKTSPANLLKEGDTVWMHLNNSSEPILGYHKEIISPNVVYFKTAKQSATHYGMVHVSGDTVRISYFDTLSHALTTIEQYICQECVLNDGKIQADKLQLDGTQRYYSQERLLCEDLYRTGQLKTSTWYDASGNKEKVYVYSGNNLVMQMQFYPSGAIKYRETYKSATEIQKQGFTEKGEEGVWEDPSFPGGVEAFQAYYNRHFRSALYNDKIHFTINLQHTAIVSIDSVGRSRLWINTPDRMLFDIWEDPECPLWMPAKINGKNVSSIITIPILYNPMQYVQEGDTVNITGSVTEAIYSGMKWMQSSTWQITPATEVKNYAVCHYVNDTLELVGYRYEDNSLFMRQQYIANDGYVIIGTGSYNASGVGVYVNTGYAYQYRDNNTNPYYGEFYEDRKLHHIVWYHENGNPKWIIVPKDNGYVYKLLEEYYPTGELKVRETFDTKNDKLRIEYFNRAGASSKVIPPVYPNGIKALGKMVGEKLAEKEDLKEILNKWFKNVNRITLSGTFDLYFEIDEKGRLIQVTGGKITFNVSEGCSQYVGNMLGDNLKKNIPEIIKEDNATWIPGTIDGNHELLRTKVSMKFNFTVKL